MECYENNKKHGLPNEKKSIVFTVMDCLWMDKWPLWEAPKLCLFSLISDHRHHLWIHSALNPDLSAHVWLGTATVHPDLSTQYCFTGAGLAICSAIDRSWPRAFTPLILQLRSSIKSYGTYRKWMKQLYFVWEVFKMFGDTISRLYLGICPNRLFNFSAELSVLVSLYLLMISAGVSVQTLL